eukprot:2891548-Pleurochrysis_carterae.AAC.3
MTQILTKVEVRKVDAGAMGRALCSPLIAKTPVAVLAHWASAAMAATAHYSTRTKVSPALGEPCVESKHTDARSCLIEAVAACRQQPRCRRII